MDASRGGPQWWFALTLFMVSGACGLIYQVVWSRLAAQLFGSTSLAVSTVLAAFMTGLALGSFFLGRVADRSPRPLALYGAYEIGIGLTAILSLAALDLFRPLYLTIAGLLAPSLIALTALRFTLAFALILIPTTLMGATLPLLGRAFLDRFTNLGRRVGALYATNTLGALIGTLASGFWLVGHIGVHRTLYVAAALNVGIGLAALALARWSGHLPDRLAAAPPATDLTCAVALPEVQRERRLLMWVFAIAGFTSFAYEVLWTRLLVFVVGNSTYAFATILATFLAGIAVGGFLMSRVADSIARPLRAFAVIQILTGLAAAAAIPALLFALGRYPVDDLVMAWSRTSRVPALAPFAATVAVMALPTILIGMTFPLAGRIFVARPGHAGADVGRLYAVNTLGNILGAAMTGLAVIPLLGLSKGVLAMAALNLALGAAAWAGGRTSLRRPALAGGAVVAIGFVGLGVFPISFQFPCHLQAPEDKVLWYDEGTVATTKVFLKRHDGDKMMCVDGTVIGGTGFTDLKQQVLAHLPKLLIPGAATELTIGMGSGILAGESARHPGLKHLVAVEIAPGVVRAASWFDTENHGILTDPRAEIAIDDGINYMLTHGGRFDIVSTDGKSRPDYAGNGAFYAAEYYASIRARLAPGGLAIQWVPTHLPADSYRMVVATFARSFPHTQLWFIPPSESFLIGSETVLAIDYQAVAAAFADPSPTLDGLRKYALTTADGLLAHFLCTERTLLEATVTEPTNRLETPYYEFYDPRAYAVPVPERMAQNLGWLASLRRPAELPMKAHPDFAAAAQLATAVAAETLYLEAQRQLHVDNGYTPAVQRLMMQALARAPSNEDVRHHVAEHVTRAALTLVAVGEVDRGKALLTQVLSVSSGNGEALVGYAKTLRDPAEQALRIEMLSRALEVMPRHLWARNELATSLLRTGGAAALADQHYQAILAIDPDHLDALIGRSLYLATTGLEAATAVAIAVRAHDLAPTDPRTTDALAWAHHRAGDAEAARDVLEAAAGYDHSQPEMARRHREMTGSGR